MAGWRLRALVGASGALVLGFAITGSAAVAQMQRPQVATPVERMGAAGRLTLKASLSCTPVCVHSGCLPEFKNLGKSVIASGTAIYFTIQPDEKPEEYSFNVPVNLGPGATHRVFSAFPEMTSCKAWLK